MMDFEFTTAPRILFGVGKIDQLGLLVSRPDMSRCMLLVGGIVKGDGRITSILDRMQIPYRLARVEGEPTLESVLEHLREAIEFGCDFLIAIGGGSTIDTGKAVAALVRNPGYPTDYLEVVGKGLPLQNLPLPLIAIPTTSGTGSEVTRNAVIAIKSSRIKVSLRSPMMVPQAAIVDPALTTGLPRHITASTGMDALTQVLEPYVSTRSTPLTDGFCREGLLRIARSIRQAVEYGNDLAARTDMAYGSLMGGMALANAGLGAVHGFAGVIGGMFDAPHGAICARLLSYVINANIQALEERFIEHPALARYDEIARLITGDPDCDRKSATVWVSALLEDLQIPRLGNWGVTFDDIPNITAWSMKASSMKPNPVVLTEKECRQILEAAI